MKAPGSFAGPGLSLPGWNSVPGLRHRHSGSRSPAADSQSAGSAPTAKPAATFGAGRRRQGGPRRLRAAGRSRVEARRARPHPTPPRRHPHAPPSRRATQEDTRGEARLCVRRRRPSNTAAPQPPAATSYHAAAPAAADPNRRFA
jgi:hypothetical protein